MATLVVGYDGSVCARAALDAAVQLAGELSHQIVIVFGYEPGGYGEEHKTHREAVRELAESLTAEGLAHVRESGVPASVELIAKRPVEALLEVAETHDARAIVVGSFSESPLKGAILGSTPHKLVHLSTRPVLIVPVADEG